jgi:hypothetical protein
MPIALHIIETKNYVDISAFFKTPNEGQIYSLWFLEMAAPVAFLIFLRRDRLKVHNCLIRFAQWRIWGVNYFSLSFNWVQRTDAAYEEEFLHLHVWYLEERAPKHGSRNLKPFRHITDRKDQKRGRSCQVCLLHWMFCFQKAEDWSVTAMLSISNEWIY